MFHVVNGRILGRHNVPLAALDCELQAVTSACSAL